MGESYESIKASLLESGSLFEDEDFSAEPSSIFYSQDDIPDSWTDAQWKRPSVSAIYFIFRFSTVRDYLKKEKTSFCFYRLGLDHPKPHEIQYVTYYFKFTWN